MKKTIKLIALRAFVTIMSVTLTFLPAYSVYAAIDESTLNFYAQNNILFYDPTASQNFCTSGGDCYIAGTTRDEKLWSGLRHVGFTPEQTIGIMSSLAHEGNTPVTQEYSYSDARKNHCNTQSGEPYTIYTDFHTSGARHGGCISQYSSIYHGGEEVKGIGLGIVQWTDWSRRRGYLEKMEELGLLKYFEGDAYQKYGYLKDEALHNQIMEDTGSDSEYWALWCAAIKFIWAEMNSNHKAFFNGKTYTDYAIYTSTTYERCSLCDEGESEYNKRMATANELWNRYNSGEFDAVENGTAPSAISSSTNTGAGVLIIGDSMISEASSAISVALPNATVVAQESKQFTGDDSNNLSALQVIEQYKSEDKFGDVKTIVIAIGTDGAKFTFEDGEKLANAADLRNIIFVNNYDANDENKYKSNNDEFQAAADAIDGVKVLNWASVAKNNSASYLKDGTVLTEAGAKSLADMISTSESSIKPSDTCNASVTNGELVFYTQGQEPWGTMLYGSKHKCWDKKHNMWTTIGTSGCGPTSLAMIITNLTGQRVTPDEIAKKADENNMRVCDNGTAREVSKIAKDYGLKVECYNKDATGIEGVSNLLRQGVMFHFTGGAPADKQWPYSPFSNAHYIGLRGIVEDGTKNGKWLIFDSNGDHKDANTKEWDPEHIFPFIKNECLYGISRE